MRTCRFCKKEIEVSARICPHCRRDTVSGAAAAEAVPAPVQAVAVPPAQRRCPFCAEAIQNAAIVCPHCSRDLPKARMNAGLWALLCVAAAVAVVFAIPVLMALSTPAAPAVSPTPGASTPVAAATAPVREDPISLTIDPSGLRIENRTAGPLEQCLVQIFGGWTALVPVIPARTAEYRFFTALFDSEAHSREAHMAGEQFGAFVLKNASAKTTVACRDVQGRRVTMLFTSK